MSDYKTNCYRKLKYWKDEENKKAIKLKVRRK